MEMRELKTNQMIETKFSLYHIFIENLRGVLGTEATALNKINILPCGGYILAECHTVALPRKVENALKEAQCRRAEYQE